MVSAMANTLLKRAAKARRRVTGDSYTYSLPLVEAEAERRVAAGEATGFLEACEQIAAEYDAAPAFA